MGDEMHVENVAPIQQWAKRRGCHLLGRSTNARRINLLALAGNEVIGEVAILQVNEEPSSLFITTCVGNMILEESWADQNSFPNCLDLAAQLVHGRHEVTHRKPEWGFAFGRKEDCEFVPDEK